MPRHALLVEPNEQVAAQLQQALSQPEGQAIQALRATSLEEALACLHDSPVEWILLDLDLPESTGLASLKRLKQAAPEVAVVLLTEGEPSRQLALDAIKQGAQELIAKDQLAGGPLVQCLERAAARQQQLSHAQAAAYRDPLTGLANRRALELELERVEAAAQRVSMPYSLAMLDLDHLKQINDTHGHECGDLALQHIARLLSRLVREGDCLARYGGDEFVLLLPHCSLPVARAVLERIRTAVEQSPCQASGVQLPLTLSAGIAQRRAQARQNLLVEADQALYQAKAAGRNCVRWTE